MVNLTYWRANFEVAILFCDFSLGSKSDILGSSGTFPPHIGGFFLNELANHFRSNLIFFFLFLRSIWPTGKLILRSLSFSLTFFLVQKVTFEAILAHFKQILEEFLWMSWQSILQVIYSCPSCFGRQFLLERNFCTRYPLVSLFFQFQN